MPNALKREAPESLLPTKQMKYPRIAKLDEVAADGSTHPDSEDTTSGLATRWYQLGRESVKLFQETLAWPWNPPTRSSQQLRRTLSHPLPRPNRQIHTVPAPHPPLLPCYQIPIEIQSKQHQVKPEHSNSLSSQSSSQTPPNPSPLPQTASMSELTTTHSRHRTADELLAGSVEQRRKSEQMRNKLSQLPRKDHIYARKHKTKVQEDRKTDREDLIKRLFALKRATGYGSSFEEFKSFIDYEARLQHLDDREILSPSASLTDLRLKEKTQTSPHRHSLSDYADRSFLESAIQKLERSMESPPPNYSSAYDRLRQEARRRDEEIERRVRPPVLRSLPAEVEKQVVALLGKTGVISKIAREQVCDSDFLRLSPHQWLNDELINFYGAMILARSEGCKENPGVNGKKGPLNVHYFNTFFWSKLQNEGYERARLAKWTKKIDIFSKDVVLIPINHNNAHWTAAAINFRRKRIESYDSMNLDRSLVLKLLRHYIDLEHQNKKKKPFDFTGWEDNMPEDIPQQENGYDCGVFTCQFLEALSRGEETFDFSQRDMPYFRRRMIWEIGHAKFLDGS